MLETIEIWKDIIGYEGYYQISNLGNVKSLPRIVNRNGVIQYRKERIMSKRISADGYCIAKLNVDKQSLSIGIHILVARHFIPNPNNYPEVNHLDFNRKNNCVDNLQWCTHQQNIAYSKLYGRYHIKSKIGRNNPNYGNNTLREKYKQFPELKAKCSRPRENNGRCVPIRMYKDDNYVDFKFIGEAAEYLVENGYTHNKIDTLRTKISESVKNQKTYLGFRFEKI